MENRIYEKTMHRWINVPPEYFKAFDRECSNRLKRQKYRGLCNCPRSKKWLCDTVCEDCEFNCTLILDVPYTPDHGPCVEDIVSDHDLLIRILARFRELSPDASAIIDLWLEDDSLSDRAVARTLGCPQRTFADRMKRYRADLRRFERGENQ